MSKALAKRTDDKLRLADSLESATANALLVLDRDGNVLGKRRHHRAAPGMLDSSEWPWSVAVGGATMAWLFAGASLPWLFGGVFGYIGLRMAHFAWRSAPIRRAIEATQAGRYDESRAALTRMLRRPPLGMRSILLVELARAEYLSGRHQQALAHADEAAAALVQSRDKMARVHCAVARSMAIMAAAVLGRDLEARITEFDRAAPSGDFMPILAQSHYLRAAFAAGDASDLPGDELYDWTKRALTTNVLGQSLVLLGWAFEQRGDRDMAVHALTEAPSRLVSANLRASDPPLAAFMERAIADWGVEIDGEPMPGQG